MASKPMTPEWEAQIVADLNSNLRIIEIANKHRIGKKRVQEIREKHGISVNRLKTGKLPNRPMTPEWEAEIAADLRSGMLIDEIIDKHRIGYAKVADVQRKYGLFRQKGRLRNDEEDIAFLWWWCEEWDKARVRVLNALHAPPERLVIR